MTVEMRLTRLPHSDRFHGHGLPVTAQAFAGTLEHDAQRCLWGVIELSSTGIGLP